MKIKTFILSLGLITGAIPCSAGPLMLNARLDSASMLMGNVNTLHLEVVQDKNIKGHFPLLQQIGPEGIATLLNDTIELQRPVKIDTLDVGSGRIQINCEVPVQVFDSGYYKLPAFEFVAGRDTARSKELMLSVVPIKASVDDPIRPYTDVAQPENSSIFDKIPDWLYYYWWIYLLAIALIVGGIFLWKRYRKEGTILSKKPEKSPYELAIEGLRSLKARKLWESGREKEYYTELTEILRKYLAGRFGIQAMEMTSKEIMSRLADLHGENIPREKMREVLDMADFVKFAMVRPLPDDNEALYRYALDFVESTRPDETQNFNQGNASDPKNLNSNSPSPAPNEKSKDSYNAESESTAYKKVARRGRMARLDDNSDRISSNRMKVGKKINKREVSPSSDESGSSVSAKTSIRKEVRK